MDFSTLLSKEIAKKKATIDSALNESLDDDYTNTTKSVSTKKKRYLSKAELIRAEQKIQEKQQEEHDKKQQERANTLKRQREEHEKEVEKKRKIREQRFVAKKEEEAKKEQEKKDLELVSSLPENKLSDAELQKELNEKGVAKETIEKASRVELIKKLHKMNTKEEKQRKIKLEDTIDMEIHEKDIKEDPSKVSIQVCATIRALLSEWKGFLVQRDDTTEEAREVLKQTVGYCKPLLNKLRGQELGEKLFGKVAYLFMYIQQHNYREANAIYIKMSVGNAAWPVGVTAVGIHARSAREKITGENNELSGVDVAHIMSGDDTRKWIIAIKRFITFSEAHLKNKSFKSKTG